MEIWIVLGILAVVVVWFVAAYNRFVAQRQQVRGAWADIDTELRRRYDLVPNLVETVKGYAAHEREVFEEVARTRSAAAGASGGPAATAAAEGPFMAALGRLFAVAEAYPDLKANTNFLQLQSELAETENRIQRLRAAYNAVVESFNARIGQFPSAIVARLFGFSEEQFFEVDQATRDAGPPRVDFGGR